jgi:hypothetical protein
LLTSIPRRFSFPRAASQKLLGVQYLPCGINTRLARRRRPESDPLLQMIDGGKLWLFLIGLSLTENTSPPHSRGEPLK